VIEVHSPGDVGIELSASRLGAHLFERHFRRRVEFRQGLERPRTKRRRGAKR